MPRPNEPQFVVDGRLRQPPRVCHTCDWYSKDGVCDFHKSEPPEDFANTKDACESWLEELLF